MRKYAALLSCIFLLMFLSQVGNIQAASRLSASELSQFQKAAEVQKAEEEGDARAQFIVGWSYYQGDGVKKDFRKAAEWLSKSAEQGHAVAQGLLGMMYDKGEGVQQDSQKAVELYQKSANQGNAASQYLLGEMYALGKGVPHENVFEAAKWYKKAADQGHAESQLRLGLAHLLGEGVICDQTIGCGLIRTAAEKGYGPAIIGYNKLCSEK